MSLPAGMISNDPILARISAPATALPDLDDTELAALSSGTSTQVRTVARKFQQGLLAGESSIDDDLMVGRYRVIDILGRGGMSTVYLAEHTGMQRRVAVKVLLPQLAADPQFVDRFYQEARAAARLDHPNIVSVHDVVGEGSLHYLVMEYVQGKTLRKVVEASLPNISDAVGYVHQAAMALAHAHQHGIVHRDIKPENLVLEPSGAIKVLDLGLARLTETHDRTLTIHDNMLGTVDYMAPEQAEDSHAVDARADIYSLGCTLYFLLIGHPPFPNGTAAQRLMFHMLKQPKSARELRPEIPIHLEEILQRCLAKLPEERYQSARELAAVFQRCFPDSCAAADESKTDDLRDAATVESTSPADTNECTPPPADSSPGKTKLVLTVRKLLAYRSGLIKGDLATAVQSRLDETAHIRDLLQRMDNVAARPWLGAPAWDDGKADPNDVAEYLDDSLPDEKRAGYERLCVNDDKYLAELADSHLGLVKFLKARKYPNVSPAKREEIRNLPTELPNKLRKFIAGLNDRDSFVRQLSAESLGRLGAIAKPALEALLLAVSDPDRKVQKAARQALRQIRFETDPQPENDADFRIRRAARRALRKIRSKSE